MAIEGANEVAGSAVDSTTAAEKSGRTCARRRINSKFALPGGARRCFFFDRKRAISPRRTKKHSFSPSLFFFALHVTGSNEIPGLRTFESFLLLAVFLPLFSSVFACASCGRALRVRLREIRMKEEMKGNEVISGSIVRQSDLEVSRMAFDYWSRRCI